VQHSVSVEENKIFFQDFDRK